MKFVSQLKALATKSYIRFFGKYTVSSLLSRELEGGARILDVGCGQASPIALTGNGAYKVGLDAFLPFVLISKGKRIHNDYLLADARLLPFAPDSFDQVVLTEVLEHLPKHDGLKTIHQMEKVAKKVILTTPNGFFQVYAGPNALNPEEKHLSGWTVRELKDLGFTVYGVNGLKVLHKATPGKVVMRFSPRLLFQCICVLSEIVVYHYPHLAFQLFCVKKRS